MARKNQPAYKSTAGKKINTKWLNNVMKSIGSTTMDSFKTIAPNLYSAGEGIASSVRDIKSLTSGNSIGSGVNSLSKNKYINYGKRAFDNIIDDLKTGNLNNTERMNQAMDDSFGNMFDDFSFGDEEEGASVTFNYMGDSKQSSDATFELAKSIQKTGEANVKAQKATVDAMISVTSASMLQQQEIGKETNAHLGNINNNIAALVAYQQENTTKFYESAMAVFDRFLKKEEEESSGNDKTTRLFNSNGGINPSAYKDYVKKQISSSLKDSNLGSMANMILSDDTAMEMVVSNPIGFASKMIVQGMVPHLVTNTIKGMEEAFTGFMPTMIAKLGEWRHNEEKGLAGTIKRLIGNVFGIEVEKLDKIDLSGKVTKDAAIFDGMTRNSIVEVIPKHLREMSSYLRDIAEHFKVDTKKSRQQAEIFDAGSGKYISIQELQKNIAEKVTSSVTDAMSSTEFGKSIAGGGNELVGKDAKTYERMTKQMYEFMSRMDGAFTPESFNVKDKDSKINQILSQIDVNNKQEQKVLGVLTETIKLLGENQKGLHHSQFAAMRGIEAKNDTLSSLGKDYDIENLIAAGITSETDINEFIDMYGGNKKAQQNREKERERNKREEKAKEKRDYKNRRKGSARSLAKHSLQEAGVIHRNDTKAGRERIGAENADASTVPGFIANTGGHLKDSMFAAMNGDTKGAMEALGTIFTDGMKTFWGSIKENFLTPLKESIFGKKGEDGYIDGGLFSGVQNKAKDIWKEIGFHINGKEYTDSAGNKHEADPENSVVGRVKGIFGTITDSIKYRLFGDKDDEGKDDKKKGNVVGGIIDTFKEGLLGWKKALFGDDPEKDADQQLSDFKEKAMKAIPDLGVGAIGGLAMSQLSGGLLGAMIGGPFTGIAIGMGTSLLAKSEKFQNYLFGPEVEDEEGNKSRVGGLISKKTQEMFKDPAFKKSAIGGAALGIAKSFIFGSSGGILGSLVGGPIAGAMFGAGLGMLKKSEMFQNFMYGEMGEDGERSGGFKDKLKAKIKSTFGKDNKEDGEEGKKMKKAFGMGAIGAGAGGVMGLLMGGPIVGSMIGLASGIAASTGKFKKWFFGEKDEDGNVTKVGMLGKVGNWMHTEIMAPMKNKVLDIVEDFKTTIKYDVFNVAKILMGPAVDYVKESVDKVKEKFSQGLDYVKEKLFAPIGKLASSIMKPVKKAVGAVVSFAYKQVKTMVTLPFKVMKHVALAITSPFVKLAKGVKKIIGWVGKKIFNAIGFVTKKAFKLVAAPFNVAAGIANYLGGKAKDKLAGVGGEVRKKKHVKGEGWRVDLKNNKIDKENELRENKKNRRERANMAYNRSLVAKTLGYDVKYLTEANYEAALKVDKKLARKMKGPGFGRFGDKSKRDFEKDPAEIAREQQAKIAKSSDADIATMDTKDQDIGTRNLIQSTRQTSILERIFNWLTGKKSKFGDSYGNVTDGGDAKAEQTAEGNKKPEDQNEEDEEENTEEEKDNRKWYEKISDEISESGGVLNWAKGKLTSAKDKVKGFFSKESFMEGFENSDLNRGIQKVKGFFGSKNRTRAKGGPVDKGKSYLVGDGGTDPSAAEVFVPKTSGKILSQKDGGIKVTIEGIATKAIQAIKSIFTGGPGNILPGQSGSPNLIGSDNSSDSASVARASVNANAEADYDEEGNLIKEKVDSETIDDIEVVDDKKDAIIAADNAADLANAKNAGSFVSQQKKKEDKEAAEGAKKQLDTLRDIKLGQDEGNKDRKEHSSMWASIFSKKGLITMGIVALLLQFPGLLKGLPDLISGAVDLFKKIGPILKKIAGFLGDTVGNIVKQFSDTEEMDARTNGNTISEEAQRKLDQVTSGNILMLSEDGSASATTGAIENYAARTYLNWTNRYEKSFTEHIPFVGKKKKKQKKRMKRAEKIIKAPKKAFDRVTKGKPSEYDKLIGEHKKNHIMKAGDEYYDRYNRRVLTTDQWDELVAQNGEEWATNNKSKYFVPDDDSFPKKPENHKKTFKEKFNEKVQNKKKDLNEKFKKTKPGEALDNMKETVTDKKNKMAQKVTDTVDDLKDTAKNSKAGKAVQKGKETVTKTVNNVKDTMSTAIDKSKTKLQKTFANKTDDMAKAMSKHSGGDGLFSKVCGYISDFFETLTKRMNAKVGKKAQGTVGKIFSKFGPKSIKEALEKVWGKACVKISELLGGRISATAVSMGISEAVMITFGAIDGVSGTAKLFKVRSEDVDGTMRLVAGLFGGIAGSTPGAVIELVCSIVGPILGIDPLNAAATALYTWIKGKEGSESLTAKQEKFQKEYVGYQDAEMKKQYDTQIKAGILSKEVTYDEFVAGVRDGKYKVNYKSFDDYNADVNASFSDKATNLVTKPLTSAAHATKEALWRKEERQDAKGNVYTQNKDGTWQVTDKDGNDLGNIAADALPKEGLKDTSKDKFLKKGFDVVKGGVDKLRKKSAVVDTTFKVGGAALNGAKNFAGTMLKSVGQTAVTGGKTMFKLVKSGTWDAAKRGYAGLKEATVGSFNKFKEGDILGGFGSIGKGLFDATLGNAATGIKDVATTVYDAGKEMVSNTWNNMKEIGSNIADTAKNVGGAVWDGAKAVGGKIADGAKSIGSWVGGLFGFGGKSEEEKKAEEEKRKKEEELAKLKYNINGDKNGMYYKYNTKEKKFFLFTRDGKLIGTNFLSIDQVVKMTKEKKLTPEKEDAKSVKKSTGEIEKLVKTGKTATKNDKKEGKTGTAKKVDGKASDGVKNKSKSGGKSKEDKKKKTEDAKKKKEQEELAKKEEELMSHKYEVVGDKNKSYWQYDKKTKKFLHYKADGKVIEGESKTTEEITKLVKDKKLNDIKIAKRIEKPSTVFRNLLNVGKSAFNITKNALNIGKNLIKKTPIGQAISFGKKMVGNLTDKFTKEEVYRDPKDKTYWKYDAKKKVYYKYNVNNQKTDDNPKTQKEIDKLFKDGKLVKDTIKKDNALTRSIDAVKKMGKNAIDNAKKSLSTITDKIFKKPNNKSKKPIKLHKKIESGKDYIYYAKKDKSYYACVGGKWYHFNKNGQKLDEKEVSYSYIFSKFSNGDLVRDKISGKTKITNEKEMKKYIKSLSKNAKKNDWESKKELDKKLEKQNKGKLKPKKRKTKKVFMSPDGDYYKKNKDGTYNHYNSIGNLIDENIDGEDKDKIEKKIKNGTLVSSEISEKKKVDASKVHGGINKTVNSVWKESQKNLEGNTNAVTGAVTETATRTPRTTTSAAKSGMFGVVGSLFSGIFGGRGNDVDEIGGAGGDELNGFKFFSQKDKRWKDKDYSSGRSKSTMGKAGCGPTAMSMVASQLSGKNLSPVDIAADAKNAGFRDKTGTNANFISYESKKLNLPSVQSENPTAEYIISELDKGHPMILNGVSSDEKNSPYTRQGHYIVAVGRDDLGNVLINDPRGKSKSKSIKAEKLAKETRLGWSFMKNKLRRLRSKRTGGYGEKDWIGTVRSVHKAMSDAGRKNGWKYNQEAYHNIKVDNETYNVRWDCSGFVSACLQVYGSFKKGHTTNSTGFVGMKKLSGFTPMNWCGWDKLQEGDIIARKGHVEIFAYNKKGKHFVYNAGSTNAINATEPSGSSHSDYTKVLRPNEPGEGVELQTDSGSSDATTNSGTTNTDVSNGFLDKFQALASEYANRVMKGDYNSDFSSVLSGDPNSSDNSSNASGETAGAATEIEGKGNIEKVWNFFAKNGFSAAAISGIIGNMYQESGVNPKSIQGNGKGPAAGIFQWENYNTKSSRWKALDTKARKEGKDWKDLGVQLDFALGEMKGKDIDNRLKGKYGIISNGKSRETTDIDGKKYTLNAIPDGFEGFKQIADVEEAVKSFEAAYERAGKPNFKRRIKKAKEVYKKYGKEAPTTDEGGSGGFGDYGDEMDIFTSTYKTSSNTTTNTNSTSDDKLVKLLSEDHSEINRNLSKSTSEEKMEKLLEKMVSILESISDSSSSSITELKKIAANSKMNGQYNTNIVNGGGTNNIIQNGSGQPSSESRNSVLARQLAKG